MMAGIDLETHIAGSCQPKKAGQKQLQLLHAVGAYRDMADFSSRLAGLAVKVQVRVAAAKYFSVVWSGTDQVDGSGNTLEGC